METIFIRLLLLLLPLLYIPNIFNPYETPKYIFLITIITLISITILVKNIVKKEVGITKSSYLSVLVIFYLLVVFLSNIFGLDAYTSIIGSKFRYQGLILLLANVALFLFLQKSKKKEIKIYTKSILASAFLLCVFSLWQAINYYVLQDSTTSNYQGRIIGTMGNPNFLAGYLVMTLPFALLMFENKKYMWKLLGLVLTLMTIIVIFLTSSRGGILATIAVLFIFGIWIFLKRKFISKIILILFIAIILIFSFKLYNSGLIKLDRNSIWDNRIYIWDQGIKAIIKRPLLGYGQENFELVFSRSRAMNVDNAHNIFLEIAVSSGLIGLSLFLIIFATAFKKADLKIKLSLIAFIVSAQFNPLSIAQIVFFWFLLGISRREALV